MEARGAEVSRAAVWRARARTHTNAHTHTRTLAHARTHARTHAPKWLGICTCSWTDWAQPCRPTAAPRPGSPRPHLHRDWAHPAHICTRTGLTPPHSCATAGAHSCHICTGTGLTPVAPQLHRDWARRCTGRTPATSSPGLDRWDPHRGHTDGALPAPPPHHALTHSFTHSHTHTHTHTHARTHAQR
jgi:hypothetical protein